MRCRVGAAEFVCLVVSMLVIAISNRDATTTWHLFGQVASWSTRNTANAPVTSTEGRFFLAKGRFFLARQNRPLVHFVRATA